MRIPRRTAVGVLVRIADQTDRLADAAVADAGAIVSARDGEWGPGAQERRARDLPPADDVLEQVGRRLPEWQVVDALHDQHVCAIEVRAALIAGWRNYATVVVARLARNFAAVTPGADIVFASDLPSASGMSSSSALMVGRR